MALVTVGNTRIGDSWFETHPRLGVNYEYCACYNFFHYKIIATERSHEKKIRIAFYSHRPTSNYYGLIWDIYPKDIIPAVFRAENGVPVEVLSTGNLTFPFKDIKDGWQYFEVYLKRDFEVGEEIWAGVWGEVLNPIWDSRSVSKGTCGVNIFYAFGTIGRKYDYAPYFDNGEILRSNQGADTVKGNYSLYWQYNNEPIPKELNVIVGNPRMGNKWLDAYYHEILDDDDEVIGEEDIYMEFWVADCFFGYWLQLSSDTYKNKIAVHLYQRFPVHKDYEDMNGIYNPKVIPVVYRCDANGKFLELMNSTVQIIEKELTFCGWIDFEITLKRNLNAGEYVFAGFYVFNGNLVWHENSDGITGNSLIRFFNSTSEYNHTNTGRINLVSSERISELSYFDTPYVEFYSLYFEYCDISPRTDYVRSVSSSGNVVAVAYKTASLKTLLQEIKNIRDSEERKLALFRLFSDVKRFQDYSERKTDAKRNLLTAGNFDDGVLRSSELKRNNSESFRIRDFVFRSVGMFARIFSAVYKSDKTERFVLANRFLKSEYHVAEKICVSRWIVRAASSVFGLWDFLRGKIREENCQTELFCPVTLELDLTCEVV